MSISDGAFLQGRVQMADDESAAGKNEEKVAYAATGATLA